jgi:CheY-like chemotaxis protein
MLKRVLLVDDESSLRRSLSLSLNQLGYDVEPCNDGMAALNKLDLYQKNTVDLDMVILDIELPDINGIKLGRIIKSRYPETSMLYITGYADKYDEMEIEEMKAGGLLEKPFTADDLNCEINKILEKKIKPGKAEIHEKTEAKSVAAYIMIKIKPESDFFNLYRKLYFMDGVLYCDATSGDIDIFLLIQADTVEACEEIFINQIKILDGISQAEFLPVGVPLLNDYIREIINSAGITLFEDTPGMEKYRDYRKSVCSYIIVDVDREKLEQVYTILRLTENVLYCDYTSSHYNLILMVHGTQFSEIDKIIENKIMNMDGVLKVKKYPIINILEM